MHARAKSGVAPDLPPHSKLSFLVVASCLACALSRFEKRCRVGLATALQIVLLRRRQVRSLVRVVAVLTAVSRRTCHRTPNCPSPSSPGALACERCRGLKSGVASDLPPHSKLSFSVVAR